MNDLQNLAPFVEEANASNSTLDKKKVIERYPQCKEIWKYIYDTINYQYGVTYDNLKKLSSVVAETNEYNEIITLLKALDNRTLTGHDAVGAVNRFIAENHEHTDLIYNIIDRNLKTRTDTKLINKIFPNTIPVFNVSLCETYNAKAKVDFVKEKWYASRKLDGNRCLIFVDNDLNVKFFSRSGKEFYTLDVVKSTLLTWAGEKEKEDLIRNKVIDGEICMVEDGLEDFQKIMKYIRKKNYTILNPKFYAFDIMSMDDFWNEKGTTTFINRLGFLTNIGFDGTVLTSLPQTLITSTDMFDACAKAANDNEWEGLILRNGDSVYEGKRTRSMYKVKQFIDAEYIIKSVSMGPFRHIDSITGLEVECELLSRVSIEHKGNPVGVGSGFSLEQRKMWHKDPNDLLGRTITVRYFEETVDEKGKPSLRFPVIKHIYDGERDV